MARTSVRLSIHNKSYELQELIKYRPEELSALKDAAVREHFETEMLPMILRQKKRPAKLRTPEERLRRIRTAKKRHEMATRSYIPKPGAIERDFSTRSNVRQAENLKLLTPLQALFSLDPAPPTRTCLDEIFRGGRYPMCGADSLQWLFGLTRKKLYMAKPEIPEGRRCFYDYRGVLACMAALLKGTGSHADWLPDPGRRRIVLTGVLFRARQEASATIARAFERTLGPHLT